MVTLFFFFFSKIQLCITELNDRINYTVLGLSYVVKWPLSLTLLWCSDYIWKYSILQTCNANCPLSLSYMKWALVLLFTVQFTRDSLPEKFTFCTSISPQRTGLILFFFHCCLPKLVSGRILRRRVSECCVCWYSLLVLVETENRGLEIMTKKATQRWYSLKK